MAAFRSFTVMLMSLVSSICAAPFYDIELQSTISNVQPMTGIVLWTSSGQNSTDAIQLEYSYMKYDQVINQKGVYDWSAVENLLNKVAGRKHQAILRFYYVYPGDVTTVPGYIKQLSGYNETKGVSEGRETWFPDWSNPELQQFHLDFYRTFAEKYDNDPRLAFVQTGFGLWAEYHIYDGPFTLGTTFPSKAFQEANFRNLDTCFKVTPWNISIDAADSKYSPFSATPELKNIVFGLFDDSFMCEEHSGYNAQSWTFFGADRYKTSPGGGEFSYYTDFDQEHVLDSQGIYGRSFETLAAQFHISYMIGNDQPEYQTMTRIKEAGRACGYKYEIVSFKASADSSMVQVKNKGSAPIYYDAYIAVDNVRATESLKNLQPMETKTYGISKGGTKPVLTIVCDRLVAGQQIEFDANLAGNTVRQTGEHINAHSITVNSSILIYSIQGKQVAQCRYGQLAIPGIPPGLYIQVFKKGNRTLSVRKLIR